MSFWVPGRNKKSRATWGVISCMQWQCAGWRFCAGVKRGFRTRWSHNIYQAVSIKVCSMLCRHCHMRKSLFFLNFLKKEYTVYQHVIRIYVWTNRCIIVNRIRKYEYMNYIRITEVSKSEHKNENKLLVNGQRWAEWFLQVFKKQSF